MREASEPAEGLAKRQVSAEEVSQGAETWVFSTCVSAIMFDEHSSLERPFSF